MAPRLPASDLVDLANAVVQAVISQPMFRPLFQPLHVVKPSWASIVRSNPIGQRTNDLAAIVRKQEEIIARLELSNRQLTMRMADLEKSLARRTKTSKPTRQNLEDEKPASQPVRAKKQSAPPEPTGTADVLPKAGKTISDVVKDELTTKSTEFYENALTEVNKAPDALGEVLKRPRLTWTPKAWFVLLEESRKRDDLPWTVKRQLQLLAEEAIVHPSRCSQCNDATKPNCLQCRKQIWEQLTTLRSNWVYETRELIQTATKLFEPPELNQDWW